MPNPQVLETQLETVAIRDSRLAWINGMNQNELFLYLECYVGVGGGGQSSLELIQGARSAGHGPDRASRSNRLLPFLLAFAAYPCLFVVFEGYEWGGKTLQTNIYFNIAKDEVVFKGKCTNRVSFDERRYFFAQMNELFQQNAMFTISSRFQSNVFDSIFIQAREGCIPYLKDYRTFLKSGQNKLPSLIKTHPVHKEYNKLWFFSLQFSENRLFLTFIIYEINLV